MPKIRTLLVDDEYLALNLLEGYLQRLDDFEIVAKIREPLEALALLGREPVDLLFLDIQMPRLSGLELLRSLSRRPFTIFTTAYSEHAVEAFGLDAVDYLPKPYSFERLLQALNKARLALAAAAPLPAPGPGAGLPAPPAFLTIKADGQYRKVALADILFVESWQEYVRIHTPGGVLVALERLKNLEAQLPAGQFLRVHRSYLVAVGQVTALDGNELLLGKHRVPVSRDLREQVLMQIFGVG
ncbi:LytTR family DNA-binding domain-containing protein [Hymenobacter sp.]|uniref:LytR/AlgR family response regulator transcription factor n=1 Tax=Hymenobacter sp. TaxID=1898978 RepID=UPI00286CA503|nr:LytTR family DNA-binding domain-containing protein [Hymenobacter sp.]